jgi:hypothetical protein
LSENKNLVLRVQSELAQASEGVGCFKLEYKVIAATLDQSNRVIGEHLSVEQSGKYFGASKNIEEWQTKPSLMRRGRRAGDARFSIGEPRLNGK